MLFCFLAKPFFTPPRTKCVFGKTSHRRSFEQSKAPSFDSAADAVVIADIGSFRVPLAITRAGSTWIIRHFKTCEDPGQKKGFEAANEEILLYTDGETVDGLKAVHLQPWRTAKWSRPAGR